MDVPCSSGSKKEMKKCHELIYESADITPPLLT
jgi:hypothetical protein